MGFHLVDLGNEEHFARVNFWNWRPTLELIRSFGIIDDERMELMGLQCSGTEVTRVEAVAIAQRLKTDVLPSLEDDGRMLLDLTVTTDPDDGTFYRDEQVEKNYSASKEWLLKFARFCESSNGFAVM